MMAEVRKKHEKTEYYEQNYTNKHLVKVNCYHNLPSGAYLPLYQTQIAQRAYIRPLIGT